MAMTLAERNEKIIAAIRALTEEATRSPGAARALLIKEGIYTADGDLAPEYGGPKKPEKRKIS